MDLLQIPLWKAWVRGAGMGDASTGDPVRDLEHQQQHQQQHRGDLSPLVASFVFSFDSDSSGARVGNPSEPGGAADAADAVPPSSFLSVFDLDAQRQDLLQLDGSDDAYSLADGVRPGPAPGYLVNEQLRADLDEDMLLKHYLMCLDRTASPAPAPLDWRQQPAYEPPPPEYVSPAPPPLPPYPDYHVVSTTTLPECTDRFKDWHDHKDLCAEDDADVVSSSVGLGRHVDHPAGAFGPLGGEASVLLRVG